MVENSNPQNNGQVGPLTQVALHLQAIERAEEAAKAGSRYGRMTYDMMVEVLLSDVPLTPELRRAIASSIDPQKSYQRRKQASPKIAKKPKAGRPRSDQSDVWLVWAMFLEDVAVQKSMALKKAENRVMERMNVKRSTLYNWRNQLRLLLNSKPRPSHKFSVHK